MSHPDDEVLAGLATGDQMSDTVLEHVTGCPTCAESVAQLRHLVLVGRSSQPTPPWDPPPSRVWDAITAELDSPARVEDPPDGVVVPIRRATQRGPRMSRLVSWTVGAAAAGLVLGGVGMWLIDRSTEPDPTRVAAVALDTLDTSRTLGEAEVVRAGGAVDLRIDTQPLTADGGYLEVWLINRDLKRMVSVGVLREGDRAASFPISSELLSNGYVIVDISRETFDDKPQHSGDSLVRGALRI